MVRCREFQDEYDVDDDNDDDDGEKVETMRKDNIKF